MTSSINDLLGYFDSSKPYHHPGLTREDINELRTAKPYYHRDWTREELDELKKPKPYYHRELTPEELDGLRVSLQDKGMYQNLPYYPGQNDAQFRTAPYSPERDGTHAELLTLLAMRGGGPGGGMSSQSDGDPYDMGFWKSQPTPGASGFDEFVSNPERYPAFMGTIRDMLGIPRDFQHNTNPRLPNASVIGGILGDMGKLDLEGPGFGYAQEQGWQPPSDQFISENSHDNMPSEEELMAVARPAGSYQAAAEEPIAPSGGLLALMRQLGAQAYQR